MGLNLLLTMVDVAAAIVFFFLLTIYVKSNFKSSAIDFVVMIICGAVMAALIGNPIKLLHDIMIYF